MSIPDFESKTGNLPPGRHEATADEVRERLVTPFGSSTTRSGIYEYWRHHRDAITDLVEVRSQWLAGSFASDKPDPGDVDVVTVVDGPAYDELPRHRELLVRMLIAGHYTQDFWNCDVHPLLQYPPEHPGHSTSVIAAERWTAYFGHDRDGRKRGFVEVTS